MVMILKRKEKKQLSKCIILRECIIIIFNFTKRMIENKFICRICGSAILNKGKYPDIHFNSKVFSYYSCKSCSSYNVFPSPSTDDFKKIYGEEDHIYLK